MGRVAWIGLVTLAAWATVIGPARCLDPEAVIGLGWLEEAELGPGGDLVATCSASAVHVWHANGSLEGVFRCPDGVFFMGCEWSPDGSMLAIADTIGRVSLVRGSDLAMVDRLGEPDLGWDCWSWRETYWGFDPYPLRWSPGGEVLAHGWCDGSINFYDAENRTYLKTYRPEEGESFPDTESLDWSPDSGFLLHGHYDLVRLLDAVDMAPVLSLPCAGRVAALSPDGSLIASGNGTSVELHSSRDGSILASLDVESPPTSFSWLGDSSSMLVTGTEDGEVLVWAVGEGQVTSRVSAHRSCVVSLSVESSCLASASSDQTVRLWMIDRAGSLLPMRTLSGWGPAVRQIYWMPGGETMLAVRTGREGGVSLVDLAGEETPAVGVAAEREEFFDAALSPDGRMVAVVQAKQGVSIWYPAFGTLATRLESTEGCMSLDWCPADPEVIAMAGFGGVQIRNVFTGELLSRIGGLTEDEEAGHASGVGWSPDGELLSVGFRSRLEVWDPWTPRLLATWPEWTYISPQRWSPDGSRIAYISSYEHGDEWADMHPSCHQLWQIGKLVVLELVAGSSGPGLVLLDEKPLPAAQGRRLDWSPNSTILVVGLGTQEYELGLEEELMDCFGYARSELLFLELDGEGQLLPVLNLKGPARGISSVDWSTDGLRIAAGSNDGTIWVWGMPVEMLAEAGDPTWVLAAGVGVFVFRLSVATGKRTTQDLR
jgi:WD40 repeat protein